MRNVKEILTAALMLMIIAAVVVAALAGTNLLTRDAIAENERIASEKACAEAFPSPDDATVYSYTPVELDLTDHKGVLAVYEVKDGDTLVGYVVKTSTKGKGKDFVMMTGVNIDGTVKNLSVVTNNETAGYVSKVEKGGLFAALLGTDLQAQASVDTVANATKTSNAVKEGVRVALEIVGEVQQNG